MTILENQVFPLERDLYNKKHLKLKNCRFEGIEDGESALKECRDIVLEDCYMDLRYPIWHTHGLKMYNIEQTINCRAALWYSSQMELSCCKLYGIKALRECEDVLIKNCDINSKEFGWRSKDIEIVRSKIESEYIFMMVKNMKAMHSKFIGKYGFQYMENVEFDHCEFDTKDAFWHSENVIVKNSIVKGEYLGWYSKNLTLINCKIIGIQPLCYCQNLKLIDCTMEQANLAFEYSSVDAKIIGSIESVKNPLDGTILADEIGEILLTKDTLYPSKAVIKVKKTTF